MTMTWTSDTLQDIALAVFSQVYWVRNGRAASSPGRWAMNGQQEEGGGGASENWGPTEREGVLYLISHFYIAPSQGPTNC